ncbi:MAG: hypothetical protein FWE28_00110 [Oscillospiraceae bacterium]|nr:hypothetical protein [Oscillospiraceae bacterium]
MENEKKITLPKELQIKMLKFFLKTSIPRKMREEKKQREQENQAHIQKEQS